MSEPLRATEAARRLGISTRDLLQLIHEHKIRYVMVKGIAHIPIDALDEYRAKAS
jgi:excisionase family DNA binding protein